MWISAESNGRNGVCIRKYRPHDRLSRRSHYDGNSVRDVVVVTFLRALRAKARRTRRDSLCGPHHKPALQANNRGKFARAPTSMRSQRPYFTGSTRIRMSRAMNRVSKSQQSRGEASPHWPRSRARNRSDRRCRLCAAFATREQQIRVAATRSDSVKRKPLGMERLYIEKSRASRRAREPACRPILARQAVLLPARRLYLADNPAAPNLPLAARAGVGHIRVAGDVAEWLKAAVC